MIEVFFTDKHYQLRSVYSRSRGITKDRIVWEAKKKFGRDIDVHSVVGYYHPKFREEYVQENYRSVHSTAFSLEPILEPEPIMENHNTM